MDALLVGVLAFALGFAGGRWARRIPAPEPVAVVAPVAAAPTVQTVAAVLPVMLRQEPTDACPERFTLYVEGIPVKGAEDWRDLRDLWRVAGPTRVVWDREQASWR
jgi:hypothetical protein